MSYRFSSLNHKRSHKRFLAYGTLFSTLFLLSLFVIQLTLPQFGIVHHQHEGGGQGHSHSEFQPFQSDVQHHQDNDAFDHHHREKRRPIVQVAQNSSENELRFTTLSKIDQGHSHSYDHFVPIFADDTVQSRLHLPFQVIDASIAQSFFHERELFVNPRAPPLLI